jgi:outer membrane protein OmpA-like peptidoglycan-associated protein/lipoprotein-anchoring transpeptidase ErfK/SrfK
MARYHVTEAKGAASTAPSSAAPLLRTSIRVPSDKVSSVESPARQFQGSEQAARFDRKELFRVYSAARGYAQVRMPLPSDSGSQAAREALGPHLDALYLLFKSDTQAVAHIEARSPSIEAARRSAESMRELLQSSCALAPERLQAMGAASGRAPQGMVITLVNPHLQALYPERKQAVPVEATQVDTTAPPVAQEPPASGATAEAPARELDSTDAIAAPQSLTAQPALASEDIPAATQPVSTPTDGGTRTLHFSSGSSDVSHELREEIAAIAAKLRDDPSLTVRLEGHSDSKGKADNNKLLSYHRALSIQIALIDKHGIDASRIQVDGHGQERPVASNASEEGRRLNRRVEVLYAMDASNPAPHVSQESMATVALPSRKVEQPVSAPSTPQLEVATAPLAEQVTYARLPHTQPVRYRIEVSVSKCTLWLYAVKADGSKKLVRPYKVATAKSGTPFPKGVGQVTGIDFEPWWYPTENMKRRAWSIGKRLAPVAPGSSRNPMGSFKIHLSHGNNGGAFRIHGTNQPSQIGRRVSLGCIRMNNEEGLELARLIDVGTEVEVLY